MVKSLTGAVFAIALGAFGAIGSVNAETISCVIKNTPSTGNWIPLRPTIVFNKPAKTAKVTFTSYGQTRNVTGKITTLKPNKIRFKFDSGPVVNGNGQHSSNLVYRATYKPGDQSIQVSM